MPSPNAEAAADIQKNREQIIEAMLASTESTGATLEQQRSFIAGYVNVLHRGAQGDFAPRDAYIEMVIPGIKHGGMTLDFVLAQMTAVSMALSSVVDKASLPWCYEFTRDYVSRLIREWLNSPEASAATPEA